MENRMKLLVVALMLMIVASLSAQETKLTDTGTIELSGAVSYSHYRAPAADFSASVFTIAPQVSYFITDAFSVGLTTGLGFLPGVSLVTQSVGEGTTAIQLFVSPAYHFILDSKKLFPFIEGQVGLGLVTSGSSSSGLSYGGRAGVKFTPVDHLVLTFAGQFVSLRLHRSGLNQRVGWDYWTIGVGVGGYF